jgi:rRNA processing protein Gar1
MQISLPIYHDLGNEFVVLNVSEDLINRAVFDNKGNKVGRIVRIIGPVSEPMGVVVLSKKFDSDDRRVFVRN